MGKCHPLPSNTEGNTANTSVHIPFAVWILPSPSLWGSATDQAPSCQIQRLRLGCVTFSLQQGCGAGRRFLPEDMAQMSEGVPAQLTFMAQERCDPSCSQCPFKENSAPSLCAITVILTSFTGILKVAWPYVGCLHMLSSSVLRRIPQRQTVTVSIPQKKTKAKSPTNKAHCKWPRKNLSPSCLTDSKAHVLLSVPAHLDIPGLFAKSGSQEEIPHGVGGLSGPPRQC